MIFYIKGIITEVGSDNITIERGGLGFNLNLAKPELYHSMQEACIYVYLAFRNEELKLYGFGSKVELDLFLFLLKAPGVGPSTTLAILAQIPPLEIINNIINKKSAIFTRISGIGAKTAEKLVLELSSRAKDLQLFRASLPKTLTTNTELSNLSDIRADLTSALVNLGYIEKQALIAVSQSFDPEIGFDKNLALILKKLQE